MKKRTLSLLIFITLSYPIFAQVKTSTLTPDEEFYLKKSRKQQKFAWLLLGGGGGIMLIGGAFIYLSDALDLYDDHENKSLGIAVFSIGAITSAASIPLFISARRNRNKSIALLLKNERLPLLAARQFRQGSIPAIALKIGL